MEHRHFCSVVYRNYTFTSHGIFSCERYCEIRRRPSKGRLEMAQRFLAAGLIQAANKLIKTAQTFARWRRRYFLKKDKTLFNHNVKLRVKFLLLVGLFLHV